jgi:2-pyrone-4,6-dicarboxylate lactonase
MKSIPGPDPDTKQPRYVPPPGTCDAHCHIFGPADRFPFAAARPYTPPDAPVENLAKLHRILGIERAVIVHPSCHGKDLRVTLDAIARSNGRYRGTMLADDSLSARDLEELHERGIRAVRFNFVRHLGGAPDLNVFRRMVERIAPLGWHAVLHLDAEGLLEHRAVLQDLPVPMVIDHMGRVKAAGSLEQQPFNLLRDFMRHENCWVKVSGSERVSSLGPPFTDAIPFAQALIDVAPDRVLWGTDWPHPNVVHMPNDGDLVDLIPLIAPDRATQQRLLVDNPARLYFSD